MKQNKRKAFVAPQPPLPDTLKKRLYTKEEAALIKKKGVDARRANEDRRKDDAS